MLIAIILALAAIGIAIAGWGLSIVLAPPPSPFLPWVGPSLILSGLVFAIVCIAWAVVLWVRDKEPKTGTYHPGLKVHDSPVETNKGSFGRGWSIRVENPVGKDAKGIVANLIGLGLEDASSPFSLDSWPKDRPLHWSNQQQEPFEIAGWQSATLNVAYYDYARDNDDGRKFTIAYRGSQEFRADHYLPIYESRTIFIMKLTFTDAHPIYIACRLDMIAASNLIYRGIKRIVPFEILRHGTNVMSLRDFQINQSN